MKKQILTIAILACITITGASSAAAQHEQQHKPLHDFLKLELSDQQKQDMRAIFKATRENNSVYAGEKKEIRTQMQDLMNMPSWDQDSAETIIKSQIQQSQNFALNKAKARNQIYNLLSNAQKSTLAEKASKKASKKADIAQRKEMQNDESNKEHKSKGKRIGNADNMKLARLSKALQLTDAQIEQFKVIDANAKEQMKVLKDQGKAHRETIKSIVQSSSFDENAWLLAHNSALDDMVAFKLIKTKARYDHASLLNDKQKQKFSNIMKRMKEKRSKAGSIH